MLSATVVASDVEHCQAPADPSWKPKKCSTRHDATASVGDHDVAPAALATSLNRLGTASFWVSALASSCATRANEGVPEKTVYSSPAAPKVHPVPAPEIGPQWVAVSPILQVQFEPGSIPAASTSATSVATAGWTGIAGVTLGFAGVATSDDVTGAAVVCGGDWTGVEGAGGEGAGVEETGGEGAGTVVTGVAAVATRVFGAAAPEVDRAGCELCRGGVPGTTNATATASIATTETATAGRYPLWVVASAHASISVSTMC